MTTRPARTPGDAELRITRILYLSIGVGGVVYTIVGSQKALGQFAALTPWWALTTWLIAGIGPAVLALLAMWAPLRLLRAIASTYAGIFLVTMATFPLAMTAFSLPDSGSPWTNDLMAVPAIVMAISWRRRAVWGYVIVTAVLSGVIRYLADPEVGASVAVLDFAYNLLFDCVFVAITLISRWSTQRLDDAAAAARAKTAREAQASARVQQRVRVDALVHDHVLSSLLIASRAEGVPTDALRELAASTLATLRDDTLLSAEPLAQEDFVNRLRSSVTTQSDGIGFEAHLDGDAPVPADIALALLEATAEAVRNSLRHADQEVEPSPWRLVTVTTSPETIEIRVSDNGCGFNSRRIPPERLGVRVSILNRMATLEGGFASVDSALGIGTRVTMGWARTGAAA